MSKNLFNSIQMAFTKSNVFDLTHDVKMSLQMGKLYPCMCIEAVPGDKFNISCESLIRFSPLVSPVMHRMDVTMHYFFVPNRILWDQWENFIIGVDDTSGPPPMRPFIYINYLTDGVKSLSNYLGVPVLDPLIPSYAVSALPYAAYQAIWKEYYRDQNLIPDPFGTTSMLQSGDNMVIANELKELHMRSWEHDYFTSALPFAQKGAPVSIPTQFGDVPVVMTDPAITAPGFIGVQSAAGPGTIPMAVENDPGHPDHLSNLFYAKTSDLAGTTSINDLRRSFRLQEWLEKNARGGTRYIESILAHFGVKSSDARLNRPEYITGTKSPVVISEVLNTSDTAGAPQGSMAGHGISVTSGKYGGYYCEEHGYIMGIMSIMPKTAYYQGLPRHFSKDDRLDYYWPSFAHLGEQEILNKEIYLAHSAPEATFGYIPRYAEYKFQGSRVAGDFQTTLDFWHMARKFATEPNLNQQFVECDPTRRIFAVTDPNEDTIYAHVLNKVKASRKMPVFGTPSF